MSRVIQSKTWIIIVFLLASSLGGALIGYRFAGSQVSTELNAVILEKEIELEEQLSIYTEALDESASLQEEFEALRARNVHLDSEIALLQSYLAEYGKLILPEQASATQFGFNYTPSETALTPSAPQYTLPITTQELENYNQFRNELELNDDALDSLLDNGFVVVDYLRKTEDFEDAYEWISNQDLPVFVTSDTVLHLFHTQFDETLKSVEEETFFDYIWDISEDLYEHNYANINGTDGAVHEAYFRNAAYYAVALSLLRPEEDQIKMGAISQPNDEAEKFTEEDSERYVFEVPGLLSSMVNAELGLIEGHRGFSPSPIFVYPEDYSQYVPRGHYTQTEKLKNYFRAFMWFGRISMLLRGDPDLQPGQYNTFQDESKAIISEYDAEVQTRQACITTAYLATNPELWDKWSKIYDVTGFYVGFSDDLGPLEYLEAMIDVFWSVYDPLDMTSEEIISLKLELAEYRSPAIYGGTGVQLVVPPITSETLEEILEATKGFRMMGQRFVPDSYMFQELVFSEVGAYQGAETPFTMVISPIGPIRGFPRGLDVMAVLGSDRAENLLDMYGDSDYVNYDVQLGEMKEEFGNFTVKEWNRNLYWSWLYALKPLLGTCGEGYPTFMRTEAWGDKQLTAALASWTELRHDTILYAKQSYTLVPLSGTVISEPIIGYVEPVPDFYIRLLDLTEMMRDGLNDFGVLDDPSKRRLDRLEEVLGRLIEISEKELTGETLTSDEYTYIQEFHERIEDMTTGLNEEDKRTTLVADVHTEPNSRMVLEEATGNLRLLIAAVKHPTGEIMLAAGPVMTYYEFKHPMDNRLTDEDWRTLLEEDPPSDPEWVRNYVK